MTLEVDALDAEASAYEPVWSGKNRVGYVTSGGYGHTVGKSLAQEGVVVQGALPVGDDLQVVGAFPAA